MMRRLIGCCAIVFATAASALAGAEQPSLSHASKQSPKTKEVWVRRSCYVLLSGSPFPQPCERLGAEPSTAIPMSIIGEPPRRIIRTQVVRRGQR